MASPSFVPERGEIWYSDGHCGFYVVRLADGVWPAQGAAPVQTPSTAAPTSAAPATAGPTTAAPDAAAPAPALPATGGTAPVALGLAAMLSGAAALWLALRGRRTTAT